MKKYTIIELMELALESDSLEVLKFVNNLADQNIEEAKVEIRHIKAFDPYEGDRGSMMDQYPEEFAQEGSA